MSIYKVKKQKLKKKIQKSSTPQNVPKLSISGIKDTAKTNKDLGMSCYILVEYSVFLRW